MTLPAVCPVCRAKFPIEAALEDARARQAVMLAAKLPAPLGDFVIIYLGMHGRPDRATAWTKSVRLLDELLGMITAQEFSYDGKRYRAPHEVWRQALQHIIDRRDKWDLPFEGHGLLLKIAAGMARQHHEREAAAAEERVETDRRQTRRAPDTAGVPVPLGEGFKSFRDLRDKLGGPRPSEPTGAEVSDGQG